ncbi:MAG: 3-dehydroquinate synthase [bacterium]|nr:3-dehydroquinate synthase [bacterium]
MRSLEYTFDGRSCRVTIGCGALGPAGTRIAQEHRGGQALVVTDSCVADLYAESVLESLRAGGLRSNLAVIPEGEASKSLVQLSMLYDRLAELRLGRDGLLVAVGGGVVSDLTGLAAATWLRGVDFAVFPTTLEATVDASIGGKTGVNHSAGKNLIGAFHQPTNVVVDPDCLGSLPQRDLIAGLAESVKHALIDDEPFLTWHEVERERILAGAGEVMEELIARNIAIKAEVVSRDAREHSGERARLNFGHTVGHAIEASCGYELRHGECVALGMVAAIRISHALGLLTAEDCARACALIEAIGLPVRRDGLAPYATLASFMASDKKVAGTLIRWVLLDGLGGTIIRDDVPEAITRDAVGSLADPPAT